MATDLFHLRVAPIGCYHGDQLAQPTWGEGRGFEAAFLTGQQCWTSASTFNGAQQHFRLALAFFDGREVPEDTQALLEAWAWPARGVATSVVVRAPATPEAPQQPRGVLVAPDEAGVYVHWEPSRGDVSAYPVRVGAQPDALDQVWEVPGEETSLLLEEDLGEGPLHLSVVPVGVDGAEGPPSAVLDFTPGVPLVSEGGEGISLSLQLEVLGSTLYRWID